MNRPILICLTPVRNEAWILRAFLSATSLWADYIIIADQMSTDGSLEIAKSFPKVKVIENRRADIHMGQVRCMLMEEARKIQGDKIIFALDADEFWSGDFLQTLSWRSILESEPDDVFEFKWINLSPDMKHYRLAPKHTYYNWATHASDDFFNGSYPDNRFIHEWRLRWSDRSILEKQFQSDDIRVIHFCYVNTERLKNKWLFYSVSSVAIPNRVYNLVSLYRQYHSKEDELFPLEAPPDLFDWYKSQGVDILQLIDFSDIGQYYLDKVSYYIKRDGAKKYAILDIWTKDLCELNNVDDPRNIIQKFTHFYLRSTSKYANTKLIRFIDKLFKIINFSKSV